MYHHPSSNQAKKLAIREEILSLVYSTKPHGGRFLTRPGVVDYWILATDEQIARKLTGTFASTKKKLIEMKGFGAGDWPSDDEGRRCTR